METKITLKKAEKRLAEATENVSRAEQQLAQLIQSQEGKINEVLREQQIIFSNKQNQIISHIQDAIQQQKQKVSNIVERNLEEDIAAVDSMIEESGAINSIYTVLTEQQIQAYTPFNRTIITDGDDLERAVRKLTRMSSKLSKQINYTSLFGLIRKIKAPVEEDENEGKKYVLYLLILVITVSLMIFASSALLSIYAILGIYSFVQSRKIANVLNLYNSIIQYCESDSLKEKKDSISDYIEESTTSFFSEVEKEYTSMVTSKKFKADEKKINSLKSALKTEVENAKTNLLKLKEEVAICKKEVARIEAELEKQEQDKIKELEELEKFYLDYSQVHWEKQLLDNIYLGRGKKNEPMLLPITKDNTLYISNESEDLFTFARLFILQMLMHVNPDYLVQIVLDYKYMGGNLQPFISLPNRCLSLFLEQDKITDKITSIQEEIFARNSNILKTVNSIEDFNNLMATYHATGESYVFVHLFGLQSINDTLKHFLRNGPKVGYYFNIYLTMEEFKALNSEEMLENIENYYLLHSIPNIGVFPEKRLKMVVASYLEKQ